ncbi:MAG TPA: hypothetical protein VF364_05910, partial [Candidatus Limnocylindria bacterium]
RAEPEASMEYLLLANRAIATYLTGDHDGALSEWHGLDHVVMQIAYTTRAFAIRRHELLGEVLDKRSVMAPLALDGVLVDDGRQEVGPQWRVHGRAFRLPEVELWRDV